MRALLMFCYFLIGLALISCGERADKAQSETVVKSDTIPNTAKIEVERNIIMFYGTSLTAGLGVEPSEAYPSQIQEKIDSLGLDYEVINAGVSGETTAGGRSRLEWALDQEVDIFVLELGANDGLRGVPLEQTRKNLQAIIDEVQKKYPDAQIVLAGMQIPPNMGPEYTSEFKRIFPELAKKNDLKLIPFLLKDVGGVEELNQPDGIHPNAEGHEIMAETVWDVLRPMLRDGES